MRPTVSVPTRSAIVAALSLCATPAMAQDRASDSEIIVTAQRREERADDVPIAATVLDAARLDDQDVRSLDRLGANVPNLYLTRNFGTTSGALVFLRGVGEGDSIFTNDPPVGIYVDDVLLPRATGSLLDLIDIERVEVLRGPQGTLYGRNTSGGAIKVVTKRPTTDGVNGMADLTIGSYRRVDARGTVNLPLSDQAALRLSGISRNQRGWGRNLTDDAVVNGQDVQGGRASLFWTPADRLTLLATADLTRERSTPRFPQQFLPDAARPGRFTNVFRERDGSIDRFRSADTMPLNKTDSGGASLRADYALGEGTTLTSITGWRSLRSRIGFDQTANPPGSGTAVILLQDQRQHSVSQEINLAGSALDGRIDWLAGGYYFHEHNDQLTAISFATPAGTAARYRTDDFFAAPSRGSGTGGTWSPYRPALDTDSWSAFASATGKIGKARLTLGARWTDERKRYDVQFLTAPDTVLVLPDGRRAERTIRQSWRDLSPRVAVDYRLGEVLAYASAAKGFRSGSFDGRARNIDFVMNRQSAIAPERVWTYEVGAKGKAAGGRVRWDVDYFVSDYTDIAFSAARAGTPPEIFRQNVGDARIQGLEADASARPLPWLEVGGWIATLSDRFTRLKTSPGCTAFVADERDLDLRFTPAFRYQLRAAVTRGGWRLGGDVSGASPYNIALCNEPQHRVTNAEQANAQLAYATGPWTMMLAATNLTDRRFNTGSVGAIGYPVAPREVTVTLRRAF